MGEKMGDNVFGKRLRLLRRERKLAQRHLAAQTGVDHTHLCLPWGRRDLLV